MGSFGGKWAVEAYDDEFFGFLEFFGPAFLFKSKKPRPRFFNLEGGNKFKQIRRINETEELSKMRFMEIKQTLHTIQSIYSINWAFRVLWRGLQLNFE